jgi:hypothetical protein
MCNPSSLIWLVSVTIFTMLATGPAQEPAILHPQTKPAHAVDRATVLIRREAEAKAAERARMFDRVKEMLPPAIVAPERGPVIMFEPLGGARPIRANRLAVAGRLVMMELQADEHDEDVDAEADENSPARPRLVVAEQSFELAVFRSTGGGAEMARRSIESFQTRRIEQIVRKHRLSPDLQSKLVLAARGDVKRVFDQIDDSRRQFELLRTDVNRCRNFLRELQPFDAVVRQSLYDTGTLFAKTLKKILEEDGGVRTPK